MEVDEGAVAAEEVEGMGVGVEVGGGVAVAAGVLCLGAIVVIKG